MVKHHLHYIAHQLTLWIDVKLFYSNLWAISGFSQTSAQSLDTVVRFCVLYELLHAVECCVAPCTRKVAVALVSCYWLASYLRVCLNRYMASAFL